MTGARCSPAASGALWWPCSHVIHNTTHTPQGHFLQLCDRDAFWVGVNAFRAAATIYGPLFVASGLLSGKLTNPRFVLFKLLPSIARSSLFVACIGFFWVRFACLGRQITGGHHRINYILGPFIAAVIGLLIEKKERRSELNVYICQQAVEVVFRMLQMRGLVQPVRGGLTALFAISMAVLVPLHRARAQHVLAGSTRGLLALAFGHEDTPDPLEANLSRVYAALPTRSGPAHHPTCKHRHGCAAYALIGLVRSFLLGVGISSALSLLPVLFNPRKFRARKLFNISILKLGVFLGCLNATARNIGCMLRWFRDKEDGLNHSIAGFLAGLCFVINASSEVGMYVASKTAESLFKIAVGKGLVRPLPHGELLTFGLGCSIMFYTSVWEPHVLRPSYFKFLHKASAGRYGIIVRNFAPIREEMGVAAPAIYAMWKEKTGKFFNKLSQ